MAKKKKPTIKANNKNYQIVLPIDSNIVRKFGLGGIDAKDINADEEAEKAKNQAGGGLNAIGNLASNFGPVGQFASSVLSIAGTALGTSAANREYAKSERLLDSVQKTQQQRNDQLFLENYASDGQGKVEYYEKGGMHKFNARTMGNKKGFKSVGDGIYVAKGPSHSNGGIKVGDAEIEGGEVIKITPTGMKILSDQKGYFGYSPAKQLQTNVKGGNPSKEFEKQFNMQESLKPVGASSTKKFALGGGSGWPTGYEGSTTKEDTVEQTDPNWENPYAKYSPVPYLLDNVANIITTANTPKVPSPVMTPLVNLNEDINVNPLINDVTSSEKANINFINRNISDSNVAAAMGISVGNQATAARNKIRADEYNQENAIANEEAKANIYPNLYNTKAISDNATLNMERNLGINQSILKNVQNFSKDVVDLTDKSNLAYKDGQRMLLELYNDTDGAMSEVLKSGAYNWMFSLPGFDPSRLNAKNREAYEYAKSKDKMKR